MHAAIHSPYAKLRVVPGRDEGVDAFRFIMAMLVVVLHSVWEANAVSPGSTPWWAEGLNILSRAAVPFFFVASGYYLRVDAHLAKLVTQPIKRLLPIFIVWNIVYHLVLRLGLVDPLTDNGRFGLLTGGDAYHLWFIPALAGALGLVGVSLRWFGALWTALAAAGLAMIGPILHDYFPLFGMSRYPWPLDRIDRHMAAPLLVFLGTQLRGRLPVSQATAALMVVSAYILLGAETYLIAHVSGISTIKIDFTLTTFLLGPAVFVLARSLSHGHIHKHLAHLGKLSLAIYLVHLYALWVMIALLEQADFAATVAVTLGAMIISTAIAAGILQVSFLRPFAT